MALEENRPIHVLAWPARRKRKENPYSYLVQKSTQQFQVETHEFSAVNLLFPKWDLIHIHWPDLVLLRKSRLFQLAAGGTILALLFIQRKLFGAKLVWTVHNLKPHELFYPRIGAWYMGTFVSMLDGLLSPSQYGLDEIRKIHPRLANLPSAVTPIGHYRAEYASMPSRSDARSKFGWADDEYILLSFGLVRQYKNLPRLAEQVALCPDPKIRLVVAGPVKDTSEAQQLEEIAKRDSRIDLHLGYIDEGDVPAFFAACDLVALTFKTILNSSSALLGLSYNRRVLAPAIGAIPELAESVGGGWVVNYDGDVTTDVIQQAVNSKASSDEPDLSQFEWEEIGRNTAGLFRTVIA